MVRTYISEVVLDNGKKVDAEELRKALRSCCDLPALQRSSLTRLPNVVRRARNESIGLELAKALRKELIYCAEQITRRPRHPIEEIVRVIEGTESGSSVRHLTLLQGQLGIPFPRKKIDLARYYAIRLVMEGIKNETIAEFLRVDMRTEGNYVAQAKERIRLALVTRCRAELKALSR